MMCKGGEIMNRIKQLRKEKGLSIDQLSQELKRRNTPISPASISKYEREKRNPKIKSWEILANYFDVSVPYIQGISDNKGQRHDSDNSISTVISTIHSILIYLGRHSVTGYIPESVKNGLVFSRIDEVIILDVLMYLQNLVDVESEDYFKKYDNLVNQLSEKVIDKYEKEGLSNKKATRKDISDVINSYRQVANRYMLNHKTTDDVIDNTIRNLSYAIEQLNIDVLDKDEIKRHFVRDENGYITKIVNETLDGELPRNISKEAYSKINGILNDAVNRLLALRKEKPQSPTFFV